MRTYGATESEYRNVNGFGVTATNQNDAGPVAGTSTVNIVGSAGSGSAIIDDIAVATAGGSAAITNDVGQTTRNSGLGVAGGCSGAVCQATDFAAPAVSFSLSFDWTGISAPPSQSSHSALEMLGTSSAPITSISQCYGNCGSPAVTLANTNSTHSVNFNLSITLFYEFQPTITGVIVNITTSLAKAYSNGQGVIVGVYKVASCPQGATPFSQQCPGTLIQNPAFFNPPKGKFSTPLTIAVTAGQWVGVALSATLSPLDINDTNTNVPMFQTSGQTPVTITQASSFTCSCKIGVWVFITGNIIGSGVPPTSQGCTNNFAQLDCLLPALSNGECNVLTPSCQTSGSLVWIIILTILSFLLVTVGFSSAHVTKFVAAGDVFLFFFLAWFFIFVGVNLILSFVTIFFLFIGASVFGRTARQYF